MTVLTDLPIVACDSNRAPSYPVAAIDNTLRTLQFINQVGEVRVVDVATHLAVARSTAHRILSMLTYHGFAEQDEARRYHPSGRPWASQQPAGTLSAEARASVAGAAVATGHVVHLATLEGNGTRFVHGAVPPHGPHLDQRIGVLYPALLTASGRVLLAGLSEFELRSLFPSRIGARGIPAVDHRAVTQMLDGVRRHRYAVNRGENEAGVHAVAVGVCDRSGRVVAALVAAARAERMPRQEFARVAALLAHPAEALAVAL